ncbi:methyltransferase domain-containing protein [Flavobacterium sp. Sd200]|uniref:methyltransferase domain-containing protein n=1 Tax=Flavobacterium sp. Sd200 TaxID=2692211 RepID=UPI00136DE06D|nr:methyltransferase domain-containing protein [Flavobacterium sp. Sd200]MXN90868.1 methyltransferase domain-containing protein [Flavobacterium sp. Sd200]
MTTSTLDRDQLIHKKNTLETVHFYNEATEDYEFWSRDFNMHFGYYNPFRTNPFKRDSMLNEMNRQIFKRLANAKMLCDLGCGMGGTMRYGLTNNSALNITGITLSEFQASEGNRLLGGLNGNITVNDYNNTGFKNSTFDGAIAIESFCHSGHSEQSFKEAYRIIKPGGRLIVADAFLKKDFEQLCIGGNYCYKGLCEGWSLEKLGNIHTVNIMLKDIGFTNVAIEEVSFKVAPSVLHVPFAITGFIFKKTLNSHPIKAQSIKNLKGSLFALLSGLQMNNFGYYIITCTKQV